MWFMNAENMHFVCNMIVCFVHMPCSWDRMLLAERFFNVVMFFTFAMNFWFQVLWYTIHLCAIKHTLIELNLIAVPWHAVWFSNNIIRSWFRSDWTRHRSSWTLSLPDYELLRSVSHIQAYSNESSASAIINYVRIMEP